MYNFNTVNVVIGLIVLLVAVLVGVPLLLIWSLNSLFSLGIDYSVTNYFLAALASFGVINAWIAINFKTKN